MVLNIAIDGPVGAGKSTIAHAVAERLGILHLDTGAMYRAIGWAAIHAGLDLQDEAGVTGLCRQVTLSVRYDEGEGQHTLVDGQDVTSFIRTPEVSMAASTVSRYLGVRQEMVAIQRRLAAQTSMLLDGRDIGTRVLPNATVKIFLTASAEARAQRRYLEMLGRGEKADFATVLADLCRRDEQDTHRAVDPLRAAEDAIVLDTTAMTFEQVVERILSIVEEKSVEEKRHG